MTQLDTERLLQSLAPAAPPESLEKRIEADLDLDRTWMKRPGSRRRVTWKSAAGWAAMGAAAAVVVVSLLPFDTAGEARVVKAEAAPGQAIVPVSTIREWVGAEDQGIQWNDEQAPERRVRLTTMERQTWIDPRDGAEIVVEQPRHETVLLPVSFQ